MTPYYATTTRRTIVCYRILYCTRPYCTTLYHAMWYSPPLYCAQLCSTIRASVMLHSALFDASPVLLTILYYTLLYYAILYYAILFSTTLNYMVICNILWYVTIYCKKLQSTTIYYNRTPSPDLGHSSSSLLYFSRNCPPSGSRPESYRKDGERSICVWLLSRYGLMSRF